MWRVRAGGVSPGAGFAGASCVRLSSVEEGERLVDLQALLRQAAIGGPEQSLNSPPSLARLLIVVPGRRIGSAQDAGGRRPHLR